MKYPIFLFSTTLLFAGCAQGQPISARVSANHGLPSGTHVQALTDSTGLVNDFLTPPSDALPQTWWHWVSGNVTAEGIDADLRAMKQIGLGGAQIFFVDQGPAGPVRYMSPEWRNLVQHANKTAEQLGLKLSITACEGWSESGGPWITPELSMQKLVWTSTDVPAGGNSPIALPRPEAYKDYYRDIAVLAFPTPAPGAVITNAAAKAAFSSDEGGVSAANPPLPLGSAVDPKSIVDLTSSLQPDGSVPGNLLKAAAGKGWTILRIGMTSTGTTIHPAMPESVGLECDKLSTAAVTANWNGALAHVAADSKASGATAIQTVLLDSWEAGTGNWTPAMLADFKRLRGYDPLPYLPALTGRVVGSSEVTERFLWDFRRTIADLVAVNHYGLMQTLAHQNGMKLQAEAVGIGMPTVADELQCKSFTDVPMGEFWVGNQGLLGDAKETASAAHIYGKGVAAAESFTAVPEVAGWKNDPYSLKALGDRAFSMGINRYVFHRYASQPYLNRAPGVTMGPWGINFERTNTWWGPGKAWISYISRCEALLQKGLFAGDICYFYGEDTPRDLSGFHFDPAPPAGYDYDVCNADVLLNRMSVKNGRIVLPDGMSYRVLVLPSDAKMTPAVAQKVRDLVAAGATVVGPKPAASPSLSGYPASDSAVQRIGDTVWGKCDGKSVTENRYGKGRVICGRSLENVLADAGLDFDYQPKTPNTEILNIHRRLGDADWYFVSNQKYQPVDTVCTFRVAGKVAEFWWPDTGKIEDVPMSTGSRGHTSVPIHLEPAGSVFVVFRRAADSRPGLVSVEASGVALPPPAPRHDVKIQSASYGLLSQTADVTESVAKWASSGQPATSVNNGLSNGDPAPNVVKELMVDYTVGGQAHSATIAENKPLALPDAPAGTANLVIRKALYGVIGNTVDVTAAVAAIAATGVSSLRADNKIAGGDPVPLKVKALSVAFTVDGVARRQKVSEGQDLTFFELPSAPPPVYETAVRKGSAELLAWKNGTFKASYSNGKTKTVSVAGVPPVQVLGGSWDLSFPSGWGAPPHVALTKLDSWTRLPDEGARYFSGTAIYTTSFQIAPNQLDPSRSFQLDLGAVKNLANVVVNGKDLGVLWKEPFRADITSALVPGKNVLQVKVTNLWPNRLIGDQFLPEDKRYTWTTYNPYQRTDDLLDSGILGPVVLRTGVWTPLEQEN